MMATVRRFVWVLAAALCCTALCVTGGGVPGLPTDVAAEESRVSALLESVTRASDAVTDSTKRLNEAEKGVEKAQALFAKANGEAEVERKNLEKAEAVVLEFESALGAAAEGVKTEEKKKATAEEEVRRADERKNVAQGKLDTQNALVMDAQAKSLVDTKNAEAALSEAKNAAQEARTKLDEADAAAENAKREKTAATGVARNANGAIERAHTAAESAREILKTVSSATEVFLRVAGDAEKAEGNVKEAALAAEKVAELADAAADEYFRSSGDTIPEEKVAIVLQSAENARTKMTESVDVVHNAKSDAEKGIAMLNGFEEAANRALENARAAEAFCSDAERISAEEMANGAKGETKKKAAEAAKRARTAADLLLMTLNNLAEARGYATTATRDAQIVVRDAGYVKSKIERVIGDLRTQPTQYMKDAASGALQAAKDARNLEKQTQKLASSGKDASGKTSLAAAHAGKTATALVEAKTFAEEVNQHAGVIKAAAAAALADAERQKQVATEALSKAEKDKASASAALETATEQEAAAKTALQEAQEENKAAQDELEKAQSNRDSAVTALDTATQKKTAAERELQEAQKKTVAAEQALATAVRGRSAAAEALAASKERKTAAERALAAAVKERKTAEKALREAEEEKEAAEKTQKEAQEREVVTEQALATAEEKERRRVSVDAPKQLQQMKPPAPTPDPVSTPGMASDTSTNAVDGLPAAPSHGAPQARLEGPLASPVEQLNESAAGASAAASVPTRDEDRSRPGASMSAQPGTEPVQATDSADESAVEQAESVMEPAVPARVTDVQEGQPVVGGVVPAPAGALKSDLGGMLQEAGGLDSSDNPVWLRTPLLLLLLLLGAVACLGAY
ncbi:hypothetical protein DQ04_11861000 [Trypanosoma grayi]|uniref:hypothetical protein n=1 Tax=Trypanosoma grayi TaxID=71804 RepID=UPI0004F4272C|nr:hypothetical protein DQ04_11861000 [Trypanosoma grayi]KEG06867.1 hypothetical protein DQ04_11861000 [Trypanosoma grayi]